MADLWRDFWIRETGTGQQVAQLHYKYDDDDDDDDDIDYDDEEWNNAIVTLKNYFLIILRTNSMK